MRFWLLIGALFSCSVASSELHAKPMRIVSLSLCTDDAVLSLVDDARIAAVTYLSADPEYSRYHARAKNLSVHRNAVEEIVHFNPDLIIGLDYEIGKTSALLQRLGYRIVQVHAPDRFDEVPAFVSSIAYALGESTNANALLQQFQEDIAFVTANKKPRASALVYSPNGYVAGAQSFKSEMLQLIGLRNIALDLGVAFDAPLNVEHLIVSAPHIIVLEQSVNSHALAHRDLRHRLIARANAASVIVTLPQRDWICPGLASAKALKRLQGQLP